MRLRVAWGGGTEHRWEATLRVSQGRLEQPVALGIEADEPGSVWEQSGKILVRERSRRNYDGLDFDVVAPLGAQLAIELKADEDARPELIEVPLSELVSGLRNTALPGGNRLLVVRSPGDKLRVELERDHLVLAPGEQFSLHVRPNLLGVAAGSPLRIQAQLVPAGGSQRLWSSDQELKAPADDQRAPAVLLSLTAPAAEGVYDVNITASGARFGKRLARWNKPVADRKVQLVVLEKALPTAKTDTPLAPVLEIDPANPHWYERLANIPLVPGLRRGPLGSGDAGRWEHPKLGQLVQLGPASQSSDVSWEAYPLPLSQVGQVHLLEIEYPSDVPQALGISVVEPNAAGAVTPIGLDSGVYVTDEEAENPAQMAKHRVAFWPRTKSPLLLITNRRKGARAVYGKIRVLGTNRWSFASIPSTLQTSVPTKLPRAMPAGRLGAERLVAGYMEKPLFPENFSAPETLDGWSHRSLDDWLTFYEGGKRLIEYLHYAGYNAMMMSVVADGSTIYPSRLLQSTPRYDTGPFFASAQDPVRKDALELLFRLFDREQLTLIPTVQFSAPLPELEQLKRLRDVPGIELIGSDGKNWLETHPPRDGLGPYYNPLHPAVQQAMTNVVRELAQRYGHHRSFGGISIELASEGYAQLPWGDSALDDDTIARFEQATRIRLLGEGPNRFETRAASLTGRDSSDSRQAAQRQMAWLLWRNSQIAAFHGRLAQEVVAAHRGARLYLAGTTLLDSPQLQRTLRPALPPQVKVADALLQMGIDARAYDRDPRTVLLRPYRVVPSGPLSSQAVNLELNSSGDLDALMTGRAAAPATLFYHPPQKTFVPSFDAKSPFGAAKTLTWLVSQMSPSGVQSRKRFAHALASSESLSLFDGGWLLPLGQEDALREMFTIYRRLPNVRFATVPGEHQPVAVRTAVHAGQTYFYFVNDSAWQTTVTLEMALPPATPMEKVGASRGIEPIGWNQRGATWTINLGPYELAAATLATSAARVTDTRVSVPQPVQVALERRIQDLGLRARALSHPQSLLLNPSFELPADGTQVPGWELPGGTTPSASVDIGESHSGSKLLKLSSTGERVMVRSAPIENSKAGRFTLFAWLRATGTPANPPLLRLSVEGRGESGLYYRYGNIGGAAKAIGVQWSRYALEFDDVPLEGLADVRVRCELLGPGEILIDDVELYDLIFSPNERVELTKIITLAYSKLQERRYSDCAHLLDSYWPQFLVSNVPLTQTSGPLAQRIKPEPLPTAPAKVDENPGMLERVKGYIPRFMQF